jgi:hypothetical protein
VVFAIAFKHKNSKKCQQKMATKNANKKWQQKMPTKNANQKCQQKMATKNGNKKMTTKTATKTATKNTKKCQKNANKKWQQPSSPVAEVEEAVCGAASVNPLGSEVKGSPLVLDRENPASSSASGLQNQEVGDAILNLDRMFSRCSKNMLKTFLQQQAKNYIG